MPAATRTEDWMPCRARPGRRVFAIGDVHGCAGLLERMHERIARSIRHEGIEDVLVVHLGDLVDRGRDSLRALDVAAAGAPGAETVSLRGNHDQLLRLVLAEEDEERLYETLVLWLRNGGASLAAECGLDPRGAVDAPLPFRAALSTALGEPRRRFLAGMPLFRREGDVLLVHAGIHPRRPISRFLDEEERGGGLPQHESHSPLWIREPFLGWTAPFEDGVFVVHGHTIRSSPDIALHRIGVDTGAYATGILTAVELRDGALRLHSVASDHEP